MLVNKNKSSESVGSLVGKILTNLNSTDSEKLLAASALAKNPSEDTIKRIISMADDILSDPNSTENGIKLAESCLEKYK